ncbi:right-handed parallel beta-helix repeat-containing protein [Nocardioides sp.]|uniref:right-handed parallel beta-helix repeat-containing protein n=1 Tax=Nocardioides sp. TaxID=35761 RepID=UPI002ED7A854
MPSSGTPSTATAVHRPLRHRFRGRFRARLLTVLAVVGVAAVGLGPAPAVPTAAAAAPSTLVVGPRGDDAPFRSIQAAVDRAASGDTVVVRGGSYHETVTVPAGKRLDLRAAPGERVWLDGSERVGSWQRSGDGWVHHGWTVTFDHSPTYTWGAPDGTEPSWSFVNPAHPMAAHPDQVWIGGVAQRQVSSRAELAPGTFFVDESGDDLYLGSDPTGRTVLASTLAKALSIRSAGTTLDGIGVRRFAPSVPHMGAVTVEAPDVTLRRMVVSRNATTGLFVAAAGALLDRVKVLGNGMLGLGATYADGIRVRHLVSRRNNTERFNAAPVAGGVKIDRTRGALVRGAVIRDNAASGLWFDESARDITVLDSTIRGNAKHGLSLEISAGATVADNVIAGNGGYGIKVNDTSDVTIWNNTIVRNDRPLNIVQDDRDANDPRTPGHDPRDPVPAPGMTWINGPVAVHNNVLDRGTSGANCLLCVEDYSERFSAEDLGVSASGNVYARSNRNAPTWMVVWSQGRGNPDVFTSLDAFRTATGQESRGLEVTGRSAVTAALRTTTEVRSATGRVALPLPAALARALGRKPGVTHLGAWVG